MSRSSVLILVGIILIVAPFAGVPSSWLAFLIPFLGVIVCIVGFSVRESQVKNSMTAMAAAQSPKAEVTAEEPAPPPSTPGVSPI